MHKQGMYLGAAVEVLGRIGRPMHYESITRAAIALGILDSTSKSPEIAMSSLLSEDIKSNTRTVFAKVRPGVYRLASQRTRSSQLVESACLGVTAIMNRSNLPTPKRVLQKAVFLTGRVLDVAGTDNTIVFADTRATKEISFDLAELGGSFGKGDYCDGKQYCLDSEPSTAKLANRLNISNAMVATSVALFLLDLALDVVHTDGLLVVRAKDAVSSIQLPIASRTVRGQTDAA